jgi:Rieske Fe-S protein
MADTPLPRRSLLVRGAVTLAAGVAGFVVAKQEWSGAPPAGAGAGANGYGAPNVPSGAVLAALSQIPTGGGIVLASKGVVLTRSSDGTVHGFSAICTHQGCTVSSVANGTIDCPCHGSRFNAQTGAVVNGPATMALPAVAVSVRGAQVFKG